MSNLIAISLPDDEALAAIGAIAVRHAQLDFALKLTLKTAAEVTPQEARDATDRQSTRELCERVRRHVKRRIGETPALVRFDALLKRCRDANEDRNDVMHEFSGEDPEGNRIVVGRREIRPARKVDELNDIAERLNSLALELHYVRKEGFLAEALKPTAAKTS